MNLKDYKNSRGRPPKRCSIHRVVQLITPVGSQTTQGNLVRLINSIDHTVASNSHLKKCVRADFIQSDMMYENLVRTINKAEDKTGWQQQEFQIDHLSDRFDCLVIGLDAALQELANKNKNDQYFDPYENIASEINWSVDGLVSVVKTKRALPKKTLEKLRFVIASKISADPNNFKIEQLPVNISKYPPISSVHDRIQAIKIQ